MINHRAIKKFIDDVVSHAECRKTSSFDIFFPMEKDDDPHADIYPNAEALLYCDRCPVRTECLDWALAHDEQGIWGGTTAYQRGQMKRKRSRMRCVACASEYIIKEGYSQICLNCGISWRK